MTAWRVTHDGKAGTCTLICRCGGCGKPAGVVLNAGTYIRLVRDPDMPLDNLAGSHTLRTGNHKGCDERTAALCPP
jgi:hypothetical protein